MLFSTFTYVTALTAMATTVFAEPNYLPVTCRVNCGRALTEFNKCKDAGNYHGCLCDNGSPFKRFADPCVKCGDVAWRDYGRALSTPMQECKMALPGPVPVRGGHYEEKAKQKAAKEKAKAEKKLQKEKERAAKQKAKAERKAQEKKDKAAKKAAELRKKKEKAEQKAARDRS